MVLFFTMAGKPRANHELVEETWLFYVNSVQVFLCSSVVLGHTSLIGAIESKNHAPPGRRGPRLNGGVFTLRAPV